MLQTPLNFHISRKYRICIYMLLGAVALGSILHWRDQELLAAEYVYFNKEILINTKPPSGDSVLRSKNYQIETSEAFPVVE